MRVFGGYFGRMVGTIAGIGIVAVPLVILAVIALVLLSGGLALIVDVPMAALILYRKFRAA